VYCNKHREVSSSLGQSDQLVDILPEINIGRAFHPLHHMFTRKVEPQDIGIWTGRDDVFGIATFTGSSVSESGSASTSSIDVK
jgi:hypothetical protein